MSSLPRTLIVDNNMYIGGYPQGAAIRSALGAEALRSRVRRPNDLSALDRDVDRVILAGSTAYIRQETDWMAQERRFVEDWLHRGVPILGICFGAQLLAQHLFGAEAVAPLPWPICGSVRVQLEPRCELFLGLPRSIGVVTTHYDGFRVPERYTIASIEEWPCYGFQVESAFGIQFHPELAGPIGRQVLRLQRLLYDRHVYLDLEVPTSATVGRRIMRNFARLGGS